MKHFFLIFIAFTFLNHLLSQKTAYFTNRTAEFEKGMDLFEKGIYASSITTFENVIQNEKNGINPKVDLLSVKAELMRAKASIRLGKPDAELTILNFVKNQAPESIAFEALADLGNYYYTNKNYKEAISFFKQINSDFLTDEQKSEIKFKEGYSNFVLKNFAESKNNFSKTIKIQNEFYFPSNYYYGLSCFYLNDYNNALDAFARVKDSKKYREIVPVHRAQILLSQKKYTELIDYVAPLMEDPDIKKQSELRQLLGQAYYEKGDFDKALPYLEETNDNSNTQKENNVYQLGITYYSQKEYTKALKEFRKLSEQNTEIGFYSMYYLADCYLKTNDKNAAKNAFLKAGNQKIDFKDSQKALNNRKIIQEEALFNFAKLSVELGYDKEAIASLQNFKKESKYFDEAQELISNVLINTRDYEKALKILDGITQKSPKMIETYQQVNLYRGIQLHNQGAFKQSITYFDKSIKIDPANNTALLATYWKADCYYNIQNYSDAQIILTQFKKSAEKANNLPFESSIASANYTLGYISLKDENFDLATQNFESSLKSFKKVEKEHELINKKLIPDIIIRLGDTYLKKNNYSKSLEFYNTAIDKKYPNFVYALFQRAIIAGLKGKYNDKNMELKSLVNYHSQSEYADDALLELGNSYLNQDQISESLEAFKKLIDNYGSTSSLTNKAYLKIGLIHYNQQNYQEALGSYKKMMSNNPNKDDADAAMNAIKEIYVTNLKRPDEYFVYAEKIPGYQSSVDEKDLLNFQIGDDYYQEGKYEEAINSFTTYIKKFNKGARTMEAYFKRAESYTSLKKYDLGLADYKFVLSLGKSEFYKESLEKSAIISYNYSQNYQESYYYYNELIKFETNENKKLEAQLGALRSANRLNKHNEIIDLSEQVITNPKSTQEQRITAYFYKAKSAQELKQYPKALESYNQVIKGIDHINVAESRYRIAQIYYVSNELNLAESLAQEASQENAEYPFWVAKSLLLLSDILFKKEDYFNSRAALEAIIENFTDDEEILKEAKSKLEIVKVKQNKSNKISKDSDQLEMSEE